MKRTSLVIWGLGGFTALLLIFLSWRAVMIGSDTGRVIYFSRLFLEGKTHEAFKTLEPFLMVTIYAALLAMLGNSFQLAVVQGIAGGLLVLLVINFLLKNYGKLAAGLGLVIILSSYLLIERGNELVPYPLFLLLNTLGVLRLIEYEEKEKFRDLVLAAGLLVFAVFVFNLALTGLVIPGGYYLGKLLFKPNKKETILRVIKFYILALVLILPWFIWRYQSVGMDFYKNPVHWLGQKYWSKFSLQLWDRPVPRTLPYYLYFWEEGSRVVLGSKLFYALAVMGLLIVKFRGIYFWWLVAPLLPLLVGKLPTETRYLYAMLPGLVVLTSVGFSSLLRFINTRYRMMVLGMVVLYGVLLIKENLAFNESVLSTNQAYQREVERLTKDLVVGERVYFRSLQFQGILPANLMIAPQYMTEEEAVGFVTWDESMVGKIMEKYQIGYVMLYRNEEAEREFSLWVKMVDPRYETAYIDGVAESKRFKVKAETKNYVLYEYK